MYEFLQVTIAMLDVIEDYRQFLHLRYTLHNSSVTVEGWNNTSILFV